MCFHVFLCVCRNVGGYLAVGSAGLGPMCRDCSVPMPIGGRLGFGSGRKKKSVEPSAHLRTGSGKAYMSK